MSLDLGQLIYTSFAKVGFQALTSAAVPMTARRAFIEQIVYQYWDSYNPPSSGYRAAYIYQLSTDQILFGWLYNDGVDDLGRSHVPYFVCYYFAGALHFDRLELIFRCLSTGPIAIVDRQTFPDQVENIVVPAFYQSARSGVAIAAEIYEQSRTILQEGKRFKLFIPEENERQHPARADNNQPLLEALSSPEVLQSMVGGNSRIHFASTDTNNWIPQSRSQSQSEAKTYQQILLTRARRTPLQRQPAPREAWQLKLGMAVGAIALLLGGFSLFGNVPVTTVVSPTATFVPPQSSTLRPQELSLTRTLSQEAPAWSMLLSPDNQSLISGSEDQTIKIRDVKTGSLHNTLSGHTDVVRSLALTSDAKTLVSGSGDRTIKIWDLQTQQVIQTLNQESPVWSVTLSPDGQMLVSGTEDGSLRIWQFPTGKLLHTIPAHTRRIFSVTISPDGKTIATASLDRSIKIWSLQTGALLRTLSGHSDATRTLAFSPDGQMLASGSWDKTIKLWNWQTGKLIRTLEGHTARVVTIAFSPNGQTLISGSTDNTIKLWAIQDGKLLHSLSDHKGWILSVAVNSQYLASGSKDQTIRVWQLN